MRSCYWAWTITDIFWPPSPPHFVHVVIEWPLRIAICHTHTTKVKKVCARHGRVTNPIYYKDHLILEFRVTGLFLVLWICLWLMVFMKFWTEQTFVTIMCRNDELCSMICWVGCFLNDSELFYLICRKYPNPSQNFCYSHSLNFHLSHSI